VSLPPRPLDVARYARDPVRFIDDLVRMNELGQPWRLASHQREILRAAFTFDASGLLPWSTLIYSATKKSGKSLVNAVLTLWWAFTQESPNEIYVLANDEEQAQSRAFAAMAKILRNNPDPATSARSIGRGRIVLSNGTELKALASDFAGSAGSNHGLTSWDEL
jgi:phage terminase large subunit-like protein